MRSIGLNGSPTAELFRAYQLSGGGNNQKLRLEPEAWSSYPGIGRKPPETGAERLGFSAIHREVVADVEHATVMTPDNPGVSPFGLGTNWAVKSALYDGDFTVGARLQWESVRRQADKYGLSMNQIDMGGASLSTYVVAAGLLKTAPEGTRIARVDLRETPHLMDMSALEFAKNYFGNAGIRGAEYEAQNPEWAKKHPGGKSEEFQDLGLFIARSLGWRATGLWGYGWAIHASHANKPFDQHFVDAKQRRSIDPETEINIIHGTDSGISPTEQNADLAQKLANAGFKHVNYWGMNGGVHANAESIPQIRYIHELITHQRIAE